MDNRSIGEQVTDEIINEQFPTRQMQIDHLKEVSETIKSNPDLKETIKTLGVHNVDVKLYEGVSGKIKIDVVS